MKENIKKLWVKALKSNEFKQNKGQLEQDGKYCALGVLSVLALVHGICTYDDRGDGGRFDNKKCYLSFNVMNWAGIKDFLEPGADAIPLIYKGRLTSIAELNDNECDFKEIAKIIEKNWKKL